MCSVRGATERGGVRDHRGVRYPTNECNRVLRAVLVGGRRGHGCMRRCSAGSHSHRRRAQNHALVHAPARPARRCHGRAQMARARRAAGVIHRSPARAAVSALPHCAGATAQRRDERRTLGRMWTSAAGEPKVVHWPGGAATHGNGTAREPSDTFQTSAAVGAAHPSRSHLARPRPSPSPRQGRPVCAAQRQPAWELGLAREWPAAPADEADLA